MSLLESEDEIRAVRNGEQRERERKRGRGREREKGRNKSEPALFTTKCGVDKRLLPVHNCSTLHSRLKEANRIRFSAIQNYFWAKGRSNEEPGK